MSYVLDREVSQVDAEVEHGGASGGIHSVDVGNLFDLVDEVGVCIDFGSEVGDERGGLDLKWLTHVAERECNEVVFIERFGVDGRDEEAILEGSFVLRWVGISGCFLDGADTIVAVGEWELKLLVVFPDSLHVGNCRLEGSAGTATSYVVLIAHESSARKDSRVLFADLSAESVVLSETDGSDILFIDSLGPGLVEVKGSWSPRTVPADLDEVYDLFARQHWCRDQSAQ